MQNRKVFPPLSCMIAERGIHINHSNNGKFMKKKQERKAWEPFLVKNGPVFKNLLRMVRLTVFCFFLSLIQMTAMESYSQQTRLSLNLNNQRLENVLKTIEDKSEFFFLYNRDMIDVDQTVTVSATNQTIPSILDELLKGTDIKYSIVNRQVILSNIEGISELVVQQQKSVFGKVTDSSGVPLPGVTVLVKGTTQGTVTDSDGAFNLTIAKDAEVLQFSFVGMKTQEIPIAGKTDFKVIMEEETIGIEEIVAVGYGTQKKVNLTGAVSQVTAEVLESRPITNLGQGLQGTVANLNITQTTGTTGAGASFNIRGYESINGGDPLILVNNVPMDINLINPSDIESVSVLKDAASAAIYGARAAYGVILITTKTGKKDVKPKVNLSAYYGINTPTLKFDTFDAMQRANYMNTASYMQNGTAYSQFDDELPYLIAHYNDPSEPELIIDPDNPTSYYRCANTDWVDILQRDYMPQQQYSATVSGGTDNFDYYTSVSYYSQDGLNKIFNEVYERYNVMSNLNFDITKWATIGSQISINTSHKDYPADNSAGHQNEYTSAFQWHQWANWPVYDLYGNYYSGGSVPNMVQFFRDAGYRKRDISDVWLTVKATLTPVKNMTFNLDYTYNIKNQNEISYWKLLEKYDAQNNPAGYFPYTNPSQVTKTYYKTKNFIFNAYANYENTFGKHTVNAMIGFNQENQDYSYFSAKRQGLINEDIPYVSMATGEKTVTDGISQYAIRGVFGRFNYNFDNRYLFEFNGRYDGSSKFPKDDRFAFFPSFSLGWRLDNEPYLTDLKNYFSMLKVRASYGSLGNQNVSDNYPYIATYNSSTVAYIINDALPMTVYAPGLVSPSLTWETVTQKDLGIDIATFNNRLNASFDFYRRDTKDMLTASETMPAVLGSDEPETNAADLKTVGWDLSVEWKQAVRNVKWGIKLLLSDYQSEITKYSNPTKLISDYYVGKSPGEIWGFVTAGIAQTDEEANAIPATAVAARSRAAGDLIFEDLDGDEKITYGSSTVNDPGDRKIIGDNTPRYSFGITSNIEWKGFDLTVFLQGIAKRDYWLSTTYWIGGYNDEWRAHNVLLDDWWSEDNKDAFFPRPVITGGSDVTTTQTRWLQDASYLRLKELTLGYTLPGGLTQRVYIDKIRVYFSGNNLWETTGIYKHKKLADPEMTNAYQTPINRTYALGINIYF